MTTLIIKHYHEQLGHSGPEHLLSRVREEFWIVNRGAEIKRAANDFSLEMTQEMPELPRIRLTPYQPSFTSIGIDYFGPVQVKRGRGTAKRYGCIFVRMTSRAVHLDLAQPLVS